MSFVCRKTSAKQCLHVETLNMGTLLTNFVYPSYKTQNVTISKIYGMHCSWGQNQIMRSTFFNTGSHFENIIFKPNRTDKNFPDRNTEPRYSLQYRDIEPQHIFTVIYRLTVYRCTLNKKFQCVCPGSESFCETGHGFSMMNLQ